MSDRMKVVVLGIEIGTAEGWDQTTSFGAIFYNFRPREGLEVLAAEDLSVDEDNGFAYYDEEGAIYKKVSVFEVFAQLEQLEGKS